MDALLSPLASLTLTQLAYVVAIDAHRHFGRAAAACHVTQPTLSMQLGKLERALGATLFDRTRAPVVPTPLGERVAAQARVVLREAARLAELAASDGGEVAGELRLGVIPTLAPYLLPRVLDVLAERHPRLTLVVEERVTDEVLDALRHDALDAALLASPAGAGSELEERPLFREPFVGYVGAGHRLAPRDTLDAEDLSLDDLWLLAEGHCLRTQAVRLCGEREARGARAGSLGAGRARFESGNLETLKRLVERGQGMTLLPALAAAELTTAAQQRLVRPFADPAPSRTVRLVRRRALRRPQLADALGAAVLDVLPSSCEAVGGARGRR
ncbi:hydrogen peroxide-inducible genes activator [Roseisolibacter sp. H3M3-2]|uniref:hydrogen peroxide-inducible genes activator n=1 Tax=Roseisolibacter sp. H3M3-2 TaxID=3031323 RepID=UPI0023DC6136|nr:hydrogen peroxide-inducible genes activator [Roseisolibacter sp. H3M3-2]MDF1503767.1 hydrogen peroxide-inducible genes activator [Roseisolibacter sp. H3M3-2]